MRRRKLRTNITAMGIEKYLRGKVARSEWMQKEKYCYVSGRKADNLEVHHTGTSFKKIVGKAFANTGIQYREYINQYSLEELVRLKDEVLRLHKEECIAITLLPEIHSDLHKRYGREISLKQIEAYKAKYNNLKVAM